MLFIAAKGELGGWWYLTLSFDFSKIPGDQGEMPIFIFIIPKEFSRGDQNHSPLWHRLRQNAKWFWRFNLTGLVWLVSKTSKNHKINVKKDKVTSYQKKVERCQKISTS